MIRDTDLLLERVTTHTPLEPGPGSRSVAVSDSSSSDREREVMPSVETEVGLETTGNQTAPQNETVSRLAVAPSESSASKPTAVTTRSR